MVEPLERCAACADNCPMWSTGTLPSVALAVGVSGISYYWHTYPAFVAECRARLQAILVDAAAR